MIRIAVLYVDESLYFDEASGNLSYSHYYVLCSRIDKKFIMHSSKYLMDDHILNNVVHETGLIPSVCIIYCFAPLLIQ
jgi:hypothetical protein